MSSNRSSQSKLDKKQLLTDLLGSLSADVPLKAGDRQRLIVFLRASDELLKLVATAYEQHADLVGNVIDGSVIRDALAFTEENKPLSDQARAVAARIDEQILVKRAGAGEACFALYQSMQALARVQKGAALRPVVRQMKALLRTGKKAKAAIVAPPPVDPAKQA